jgi:hypothetical protein
MIIRLADIANPKVHRVYGYWQQRCADGRLMSRAALDPTELRDVLAHLFLIDVGASGNDFRFLIAGTEIEDRYGRSLRGVAVAETYRLVTRFDTSGQWAETAADGKPRYRSGPMGFPNSDVYTAERVMLPLSADGRRVDHIFGAIFYAPLKRSEFSETATVGILEA